MLRCGARILEIFGGSTEEPVAASMAPAQSPAWFRPGKRGSRTFMVKLMDAMIWAMGQCGTWILEFFNVAGYGVGGLPVPWTTMGATAAGVGFGNWDRAEKRSWCAWFLFYRRHAQVGTRLRLDGAVWACDACADGVACADSIRDSAARAWLVRGGCFCVALGRRVASLRCV